jgi:hypothetical protein
MKARRRTTPKKPNKKEGKPEEETDDTSSENKSNGRRDHRTLLKTTSTISKTTRTRLQQALENSSNKQTVQEAEEVQGNSSRSKSKSSHVVNQVRTSRSSLAAKRTIEHPKSSDKIEPSMGEHQEEASGGILPRKTESAPYHDDTNEKLSESLQSTMIVPSRKRRSSKENSIVEEREIKLTKSKKTPATIVEEVIANSEQNGNSYADDDNNGNGGESREITTRRRGRPKTTMTLSRKISALDEEDQREPLSTNSICHSSQAESISSGPEITTVPAQRKKPRSICETHDPESLVMTTEVVNNLPEVKSSEQSPSISISTDSDLPILPVQSHATATNTSFEHRQPPIPCQIRLSYMVSENFATAEFCTASDPDRTAFRRLPREPYCNVSVGFTFGHIIEPALI